MQVLATNIRAFSMPNFNSKKSSNDDEWVLSEPVRNIITRNSENTKKLEDAQNAKVVLNQVANSSKNAKSIKKQHALARFEELNKQIQMLKKMLSGDPKALAKALARMARELKEIVKEYGDAIKGSVNIETTQAQPSENLEKPQENQNTDEVKTETNPLNFESLKADPKFKGNDPIAAYAKSLLTSEHGDFMKSVKGAIDEIKHYMGLAKAKLKMQRNDKENNQLIKDNEKELEDAINAASNLQQEIDAPKTNSGILVSFIT